MATDWIGMAECDITSIIAVLSDDLSDFAMVPDRSMQGVVNALYLMRLAKGALGQDPVFHIGPGSRSVIDFNFGVGNPIYSGSPSPLTLTVTLTLTPNPILHPHPNPDPILTLLSLTPTLKE